MKWGDQISLSGKIRQGWRFEMNSAISVTTTAPCNAKIYFESESSKVQKEGGRDFVNGAEPRKFQKFMENNGLIDLDFVGSRFTWYNNY